MDLVYCAYRFCLFTCFYFFVVLVVLVVLFGWGFFFKSLVHLLFL